MNQPVLELNRVTKQFEKKGPNVLNGASLAIPKGSVVGLLGKNGSGKTTLLKCAMGLLKIDAGQAHVFGEQAWDLSAQAKEQLGYVPQVISLYPWMRVGHLIGYTASFYKTWNDRVVDSLVEQWELDTKARIGPLSVGQLQKLALVLSLGHQPKLLVLDEPVASLDPGGRRTFLRTILDMAMDGETTVLFSTHITSDLERVADSVAILKDGAITYHGELDALKDDVKRLHISSKHELPATLNIPGTLSEQVNGCEAITTVRGPIAPQIEKIKQTWDATVSVEDLNLEDIFLEMHHETAQPVS